MRNLLHLLFSLVFILSISVSGKSYKIQRRAIKSKTIKSKKITSKRKNAIESKALKPPKEPNDLFLKDGYFDYIDLRQEDEFTSRRVEKWYKELKKDTPEPTYIPFYQYRRIIAELPVKYLVSDEVVISNLQNAKQLDYNGVLVLVDGTETAGEIFHCVSIIHSVLPYIWMAVSSDEDTTAYTDYNKLMTSILLLSQYSENCLLGWLQTSAYFWQNEIAQEAYIAHIASIARKGNPQIALMAELYLNHKDTYKFSGIVPEWTSCVIGTNFGYTNVVASGALTLIKKSTEKSVYGSVLGRKPYYIVTDKEKEEKKRVESKLLEGGFTGTITVVGNGRNNSLTKEIKWLKGK